MTGPLAGIRILDLSRILAGPACTQLLGDYGADVIKIEKPGAGDDTRTWGPPFVKDADGNDTQESTFYLCANRNKRSVAIDIAQPEGQALIRRLLAKCDVLIENFRAGALAKYNLGYDNLRDEFPDLVYCSITGFGQTGPRRNQVAYDFLIQAMGGMMSITGEEDGRPGGGPQKIGVPMVDLTTGLYAVIGVLAAIARRDQGGEGEYIDIGMLDVQTNLLANQAMNFLLTGNTPRRHGNGHPNIMPQHVFHCADGDIVLAVGNDGQFRRLCEALGDTDLLNDGRLTENRGRVAHRDELLGRLADHFAGYTRADLLARLDAADVPAGPINSVAEVFAEPQVQARGMAGELDHPTAGKVPQVFSPLKFTETPLTPTAAPPLLGAESDEILKTLGYTDGEIARLHDQGAI